MQKNSHQEKYGITTISFGQRGEPARNLKDLYVKKHGKKALSQLVRKLITIALLPKHPEHNQCKIDLLKHERKENGQKLFEIGERQNELYTELKALGIAEEDIP